MLKIIKADKDTYITNKVIKGVRKFNSNVGAAGTLDLFKLYGASMSGSVPNSELSRILVHFDLTSLRDLYESGKLNISDPSFFCKIHLSDVYGGQPTPVNFQVSVFPLSASFDEGIGKDVSYYADYDICNWLTSSLSSKWFVSGCGLACGPAGTGDYITSSVSLTNTEVTQTFVAGDEDLVVDVTQIVSATLKNELPESGFRISFSKTLEDDEKTYFVKRFASRNAYDESRRPQLRIGFDDSISDDTQNLTFDTVCKLSLYNTAGGNLTNLTSGSALTPITGSNSLKLKLITEISGGYYDLVFSGSQFSYGSNYVTGTYQSSVIIPSTDATIAAKILQSGSVSFIPVWSSNDLTVSYVSGSSVTFSQQTRSSHNTPKVYTVTTYNMKTSYSDDEEVTVRVNIFDDTSPLIKLVKVPVNLAGIVLKNVHYQIKDDTTGKVVIPYDDVKNSTKLSSDSEGMYFKFDTSSLVSGRTYNIDIMITQNGIKTKFENVSTNFRIDRTV